MDNKTGVDKNRHMEVKDPERNLDVKLSQDRMTAYASVKYIDGIKYTAAKNDIDDLSETGIYEKLPCEKFTLEEAKKILKEKGIVFGILDENLQNIIEKESDIPVEIARGIEPVDGTDDIVVAKFDMSRKFEEINDRVDFYSIGKVVSVNPGDIIAEKIQGSEGSPGKDVLGNEIKQRRGKRIALKAGRGARLSEDGFRVISEITGRPELKGDITSVHEVYEVRSDVCVSTGNIEFVGNVVIKGNVNEGMKVKAGNSVIVYGNVTNGEITAGGDVTVYKNIIGSKIRAGHNDFMNYRIIDLFEIIKKFISDVFSAVNTLKETGKVPKIYKDGEIIKLLIDTKFNNTTSKINELKEILTENKEIFDMDTLKAGATIIKFFTGKGPLLIENYFNLKAFAEMVDRQIENLKERLKEPSRINAFYVQNSELTTSGDIIIEGKGSYNSELFCRGNIYIEKRGSVARGGTLCAGGEIKIYELGSQGGAITTVSAGKDSQIQCEIAYANSIIKVGEFTNKLENSCKKLKAFRCRGELFIERSKL